MNLRPTDYESAALTAELRAHSIHCNQLRGFCRALCFYHGGNRGFLALRSRFVEVLQPFKRPLHRLGSGRTCRGEFVTLPRPALRTIVRTPAPASPRWVNTVYSSECNKSSSPSLERLVRACRNGWKAGQCRVSLRLYLRTHRIYWAPPPYRVTQENILRYSPYSQSRICAEY